jgi:hypothetical protein
MIKIGTTMVGRASIRFRVLPRRVVAEIDVQKFTTHGCGPKIQEMMKQEDSSGLVVGSDIPKRGIPRRDGPIAFVLN